MKTEWWVVLGAALAIAAFAAGCGGGHGGATAGEGGSRGGKGAANSAGPVLMAASDVAVAAPADLAAGVPVSGTLAPGVDVRLTAPVAEVVDEVLVREGEAVRQGQLLARFRLGAIEAAAVSAQAQLEVAAADLERQRNLYAEGAVSKRDREAAEAAFKVAQAAEAQATRRLEDARMRAPIAGVISVRSVESGDRPAEGDPMFRLVNTTELEFEATIPSEHVARVRVGSPVRLDVTGFPAGGVEGRVARVNAAVDAATRQVKLYVRVPNPGGRLVGGLFASGNVVTQEEKAALAVPGPAVREDERGAFVLALKQGVLERRDVRPGLRDPSRDLVEILSGLAAGDSVIVGPIAGLTPGQPVRIAGRER